MEEEPEEVTIVTVLVRHRSEPMYRCWQRQSVFFRFVWNLLGLNRISSETSSCFHSSFCSFPSSTIPPPFLHHSSPFFRVSLITSDPLYSLSFHFMTLTPFYTCYHLSFRFHCWVIGNKCNKRLTSELSRAMVVLSSITIPSIIGEEKRMKIEIFCGVCESHSDRW